MGVTAGVDLAPRATDRVRFRRRLPLRLTRATLSVSAGMIVWEVTGWVLGLPWLPPLSRVMSALVDLTLDGEILGSLAVTLRTLVIGLALSLAIGIPVGVLMGRYRKFEQAFSIYVYVGILLPGLAMAPVYFAIFGLSDMTRVLVVVQFAVFFLIVNTATAVRTVDRSLEEMGRSFGADEFQLIIQVVLPASSVLLFAGLRIAVGRAIKGMISGEMFIAFVGLGAVIQKYGTQFDAAKVLAIALLTLVLALVLGASVGALERRFTNWAD